MNQNLKIALLIIGIIITGSIEHITIPIMVTHFNSLYFIVIVSTIHGCLNYGIVLLVATRGKFVIPTQIRTIIIAGSFNALMSICFIYSANPVRTPVVIQSIFLGLAIIPTVFFRKIILNKIITYNKYLIIPSIILLIASVIISVVPLVGKSEFAASFWILMYLGAIILLSFDNVMQEKYVSDTADTSFVNKISFVLFSSIFQLITLVIFFWVELLFGYTDRPFAVFLDSFHTYITNWSNFLVLELFILDCLILYLLCVYLNSLSTNFNMIVTNVTNQSVAIFFAIFPNLNHGIHHPLYIIIICLCCNLVSVVLWIFGEKNIPDSKNISDPKTDNNSICMDIPKEKLDNSQQIDI